MSTSRDIVRDIGELVDSLSALLATKTAQEVPNIASELGAESQLNDAIGLVEQMLEKIKEGLLMLKEPVNQVGALSGVLGLMEPFIKAIEGIAGTTGDQLTKMGLVGTDAVTGPVKDAATLGKDILQGGQAVLDDLPTKEDLDQLITDFDELKTSLQNLKVDTVSTQQAVA